VALPALEGVERAVAAQALSADAGGGARARALFEARYAALVEACNRCHETTAHGYVRIVVPEASGFPNQDFRPSGAERMEDRR
jgi:cytochrome c553